MVKKVVLMAFLGIALSLSAVADEADFLGKWDAKMNFNGNEISATLTIEKDAEGKLTGKWAGQRGESALSNIKIDGNKISFDRNMNTQQGEFTLSYKAELKDGKLEGSMETPQGSAPFTATKAKAE